MSKRESDLDAYVREIARREALTPLQRAHEALVQDVRTVERAQAAPPCSECAHGESLRCNNVVLTGLRYSPVDGKSTPRVMVYKSDARAEKGACGVEGALFAPIVVIPERKSRWSAALPRGTSPESTQTTLSTARFASFVAFALACFFFLSLPLALASTLFIVFGLALMVTSALSWDHQREQLRRRGPD